MENNLNTLKSRLNEGKASEAEKAQWQRSKEEIERTLKQSLGKNEFTNTIFPLNEEIKDHPDIGKLIEAYHSKFLEPGKSQRSKR